MVYCFEDLKVWQKAHDLVLNIYSVTGDFPSEEKFGLTSQMRRSAVSVPANIAEGFRKHGIKDKIKFYNISHSSLDELHYYLILSKDLNYILDNKKLLDKAIEISKMLSGLISSVKR